MSGMELVGLFEKAKELDQLRKDQEDVLTEINKIHKKLQASKIILLPLSLITSSRVFLGLILVMESFRRSRRTKLGDCLELVHSFHRQWIKIYAPEVSTYREIIFIFS